jgi:uncharacterized membrane protein YeaQ/YmgE (transglycosylase-associated protein family)
MWLTILEYKEKIMSIIAWIVVGLIAGWIANMIMSSGAGNLVADLVVGVLGAIIGGFVMGLITGRDLVNGFNFETVLVSILGAIILIGGYRAVTGQRIRQ